MENIEMAVVLGLELSAYYSWKNNLEKYNTYDSTNYPLKKTDILKKNKYAWWIGVYFLQ